MGKGRCGGGKKRGTSAQTGQHPATGGPSQPTKRVGGWVVGRWVEGVWVRGGWWGVVGRVGRWVGGWWVGGWRACGWVGGGEWGVGGW